MRIVRYLSKRDFSHVEDVNLTECGGFLRERKYMLSIIYEESGSHPVKIKHHNKTRPQQSSHPGESRRRCSSCSDDEEFSSTEDTPVDRVKNRKKRKRAKHSRREILSEERSLFTLEL